MNKKPLNTIGYGFVAPQYLPHGQDEYYLRNKQNDGTRYRNLTAYEIEVLVRNNNSSDNWNCIQVSEAFNPELVKGCKFFGLVRMGKLDPVALEYHNVCMPVGLYNSTIISCDFGDNVVVNNVNYMSHYIIGNEVMLSNIHELHVTDHCKFGNGILREGEDEAVRIWMEVCNENGGRKILPFKGMLPGDAWLWTRNRDDKELMAAFKRFTETEFGKERGYYGKVGNNTVIKNTSIIKDVWIGSNAYIKGANKLKNLTINSSADAPSQIGEGCELVNGIIEYGCRIFYGVKAVRFMMASHSQLKYGARLINSYLGNNATISCCEVLNSLIFPAHEQHHNNSFLCAAVVMGQSNMAAGATIGSNHNSRAADGEILAGRGFWPGLCVSLKHNSRFASFTLIAKGDYPAELDIKLPFSLVSQNESADELQVMPAYWPMYNMYALARNAGKYVDRDKRRHPIQYIEYDFLAPDSVAEMLTGLQLIEDAVGEALEKNGLTNGISSKEVLLQQPQRLKDLKIIVKGFENSNRPTVLLKAAEAYQTYRRLIKYYAVQALLPFWEGAFADESTWQKSLPQPNARWTNIGGQLVPQKKQEALLTDIKNGAINNWAEVHQRYKELGEAYTADKAAHAWYALQQLDAAYSRFDTEVQEELLTEALATKAWITKNIYTSRQKDYQNSFRKMLYSSDEEMNEVLGGLEDNVFIKQQEENLSAFKEIVSRLTSKHKKVPL